MGICFGRDRDLEGEEGAMRLVGVGEWTWIWICEAFLFDGMEEGCKRLRGAGGKWVENTLSRAGSEMLTFLILR